MGKVHGSPDIPLILSTTTTPPPTQVFEHLKSFFISEWTNYSSYLLKLSYCFFVFENLLEDWVLFFLRIPYPYFCRLPPLCAFSIAKYCAMLRYFPLFLPHPATLGIPLPSPSTPACRIPLTPDHPVPLHS